MHIISITSFPFTVLRIIYIYYIYIQEGYYILANNQCMCMYIISITSFPFTVLHIIYIYILLASIYY